MKEQSLSSRSGYRLRWHNELEGGRNCTLQVWTPSYDVTLFMSTEEAEQFVDDVKEEFFGERRHSD